MTESRTLGCEARVCETDRSNAVILGQVETHEGLKRVLLPVGKPRKNEQTGRLDLPILSSYGERSAADAVTTHHPLSAWPQIRVHMGSLKSPFGSPPLRS